MKKYQKKHFWNFALFTRFNLLILVTLDIVQLVWVTLSLYLLGVHTEVDEGIEGGVGHGQPEEG